MRHAYLHSDLLKSSINNHFSSKLDFNIVISIQHTSFTKYKQHTPNMSNQINSNAMNLGDEMSANALMNDDLWLLGDFNLDNFFILGQNGSDENEENNGDGDMQAIVDPFNGVQSTFDASIGILEDALIIGDESDNSEKCHSMETEKNNINTTSSPVVDGNDDDVEKVDESSKKKYKCQCSGQSQQIVIVINLHSKIIGCLDCGKMRLIIENHQEFFEYLVGIGKKKALLNELEISLKFRREGNYFNPIVENGDLHQLLTVNLFQNFLTLCNIKGKVGKETFADKIKRNEGFLPFTFDELSNMKMSGSSFISTQVSKKRDSSDEQNEIVNNCKIINNKKARRT